MSVRDLVRAALRMRPDRIVVGEVRGGEALDMLQALNTGHDGSLSTVHANGAVESLARIETLVLLAGVGLPIAAIRAQVVSALDVVVHVARLRDGTRRVEAIGELRSGAADDGASSCSGLRLHALFERQDDGLAPVEPPGRVPRRPDAPPPDPGWWL